MSAIIFFAHLIQAVFNARDSLRIAIQLMLALEVQLDSKLNYLLALYTHMQEMEASMKSVVETTSAVTINLRGTLFVIETEHLTASSNIFFHTLIYSDPTPIRGHYFIDRPVEGFDLIVNAMKGEELSYEGLSVNEAECIDDNLKYFQLPLPRFKRNFHSFCKWTTRAKNVSCLYSMPDGRLCICLDDGVIQLWNTTLSFECEMELLGRSYSIKRLLQLIDGRLCTAAPDDGVIKFWNLSSGECEATIRGHKYNITAILQYSPTQICCSSFDTKIRIWNIDSGVCEKIISTDKLQISLQRLPNGTIASLGSMLIARDSFVLDINVWDISTTSSVMTIQVGNSAYFTRLLIQLSSGELCASTSSGIHMYNYQTGVKIKTIALPSGTDDLYSAALLHNQRLCLSTSKASTQKSKSYHLLILNLESEEYEQDIELEGEHSHITQLNDGRLISSCQDILTEWR